MASLGELECLTDEEYADLSNRVERFCAAWKTDGSITLEWFLPPPGSRHRFAVLASIVLDDMERRAQAGLPFRLESYITKFPEDLTANNIPIEILAREYVLRHRCADKPVVEEYRRRFPTLYEAFAKHVAEIPSPLPTVRPGDTPVTAPEFIPPTPVPRIVGTIRSLAPDIRSQSTPVPPRPARVGELIVTDSVNITPLAQKPTGDSTFLPADTPYELVRRIGSGAFGEVHEAFAPGGIRVAVKRILRTVDHPASRSEREALDVIKGLSHPFLLKTNAYWVFDDRLVIVMELAEGSLGDRLEHYQKLGHTGVPPEELIPLFEQAAEALDYLHSQNVSHRDVKPENILILQGYAKVGDFGLAHLHSHAMTVVPNTVGTPAYMPPEMWKQQVSLQSDQYSFAATYVRARLGRHLYATNILVDQANCHIHDTPNLDPLPTAEQKVLLKALAKEPEDRFAACSEFTQALRAAVFPEPEPPPPPQPSGGSGRGALWGALMVAVACALTVAFVLRFSQKPEDGKKDETDKEKVIVVTPPPDRRFASYPPGWQPPQEGVDVKQIDDKFYHRKLTRKIGDRELTAFLIYPTPGIRSEPYYMLEYKITNKVFNAVWDRISRTPSVKDLLADHPTLVPGRWRKDESGKPLDIDGADADLPVLDVTVPEAIFVAEWLGGSLPSQKQWQKATGVFEDDVVTGPAGPVLEPPAEFAKINTTAKRQAFNVWRSEQLRQRNLALGLRDSRPRPLAVNDPHAAGDVSFWKIRQLISNGQEWLGQADLNNPDSRITIFPVPDGERQAFVVGHHPRDLIIDSPSAIRGVSPQEWPWTEVQKVCAGFRIVLIPR